MDMKLKASRQAGPLTSSNTQVSLHEGTSLFMNAGDTNLTSEETTRTSKRPYLI